MLIGTVSNHHLMDSRLQIDDLMGMQACNLQNLPENYTMKYCAFFQEASLDDYHNSHAILKIYTML